jgi:hypothetical protein
MKAMNAGVAAAVVGLAIFLDAAVETFLAGSPVRWWVSGGAVFYVLATAATWRSTIGWRGRLAIAGIGLSALVAVTAWDPAGSSDGVRLAGQPTARVLASLAALGVVLAGLAVIRFVIAPLPIRIAMGAVAAYGAVAFVLGAVSGTPFAAMLAGHSLWQRLPAFLQGAFLGGFIVLPLGLVAAVVTAGLRRPAAASLRADVWKIAAIAASLGIVLAGLPLRSTWVGSSQAAAAPASSDPQTLAARLGIDPNAPRPSPAALNAALTNSLKAIEDGERETPRDRWDPKYVLSALGSDPQRIFNWVQANTDWIPYRGLLRGSAGVLMDRLGNSLDRAALLATLLKQAGRTVRLAHGSLSNEQAMQLLGPLLAARYASARSAFPAAGDQLSAIAAQYQLDEVAIRRTIAAQADFATRKQTQLLTRVPEQTKRLAAAVGSGPNDLTRKAFERAIEALRDHWWVQVNEGGAWQDFDLVSTSTGTALGSPDQTIDLNAFPNQLRHQVTVRVIAEQWANGSLREKVALESVLRPTQLIGVPLVLRFMPARFPADFPPPNVPPEQALRTFALDQHEWTPMLAIGEHGTRQSMIRDTGELAPVPADTGPAGAMGGAIGGAAGGLAKRFEDAFGGSPKPAAEPEPDGSGILTSAWIEYEFQRPGERPDTSRRALFDLIGPSARTAKPVAAPKVDEAAVLTRSLALMRDTEILPIVCRLLPEYVAHLAAQSVLANRDLLADTVRGDTAEDAAQVQKLARALSLVPTRLYGLALARFEWSRVGGEIHIDRTNLFTRHTFFAPAQQGFKLVMATDIVANDIGVDIMSDNPFAVRLEQGVLDTNAEAILASDQPNASNAGWVFAGSDGWMTLRTPREPQLSALRLPDDVRSRIVDDLAAGYIVVAPSRPIAVGADAFAGWWRVNPATGHALGMGSTGWGQEFVEYLVTLQASMVFYMLWCRLSSGPGSLQSCRQKTIEFGIMTALFSLLSIFARAMMVGGRAPAGGLGGGKGPKVDPFAKTEPGLPASKTPTPEPAPGPGGGGPGGRGGGPSPPGPSNPNPGKPPGPNPKFDEAAKRFDAAQKRFYKLVNEGGEPIEIEKARSEMTDAFTEMIYAKSSPENKPLIEDSLLKEGKFRFGGNWPLFNKGQKPAGNPTPPTGPSGTQIIPPSTSPKAPTLPGQGPGGTQVIPQTGTSPTLPQINCAGTPCVSPYAKTQTGLSGALNALGQKGGG